MQFARFLPETGWTRESLTRRSFLATTVLVETNKALRQGLPAPIVGTTKVVAKLLLLAAGILRRSLNRSESRQQCPARRACEVGTHRDNVAATLPVGRFDVGVVCLPARPFRAHKIKTKFLRIAACCGVVALNSVRVFPQARASRTIEAHACHWPGTTSVLVETYNRSRILQALPTSGANEANTSL